MQPVDFRAALRRRALLTTLAALATVGSLATGVLLGVAPVESLASDRSTLDIGLASELRSLDPHRATTQADDTVTAHVFETLIRLDGKDGPAPALATAWTQQDENTWRFTLRPDVQFHDGSRMTMGDVVLSIKRAVQLRPEFAARGAKEWLSVESVDSSTIRVRTVAGPSMLMQQLATIRIISAEWIRGREGERAAKTPPVGTGPYRIAKQTSDTVTLVAHERYWGRPPAWKSVSMRALPSSTERVAALFSGTLDVVERVPPEDGERLGRDVRFRVHRAGTGRLMYLQLGTHAANPPDVAIAGSSSQTANPLLDVRVRRAISEALDRSELASIGARSWGEPAGQLVPPGFFGHVPGLLPDRRNLEDASALLAEAGYPNGFALRVHGPKGVYPGDAEVLAALARMLGEANIRAEAVSDPPAAFASRAARQQFSAYMRGFAGGTLDATESLVALLASADPESGAGSLNWGRYSNGTLDSLIRRALDQPRNGARELMLQEATRLAMRDVALVPLYFADDAWGSRAGLGLLPRSSGLPLAERVTHRAGGKGATAALPAQENGQGV
jgi:peptide/nickel transport system substrate-binding protein